MEIEVNETSARGMAARLRSILGEKSMSQATAFETLSQVLGFKNWDTFSGMLKAKKKQKNDAPAHGIKLAQDVELFLQCYTPADATCPDYGKKVLTQEFIDTVARLRQMCRDNDLSECRQWWGIHWGGTDTDLDSEFSMELEELVVAKEDVWFVAVPKHAGYHVETRALNIDKLFEALRTQQAPDDYLVWHKGHLVYAPDGESDSFVDELKDFGEL